MKIIYSWGHHKKRKPFIEKKIRNWIKAGYDITSINHRAKLGIERAWSPQELDKLYTNKDENLHNFYNKIADLAETHDILIVNHENIYHPRFVKSLDDIYTVIVSGDDPESSDYCSKPYVHAFDHAFAWGIKFDENTKVTEKFIEWGAKRANWWPYGVTEDMYDSRLTTDDIYHDERDIDVIFIGGPYTKVGRLIELKKALKDKMVIYGRGWSWIICLKNMIGKIKELPVNQVVPVYQQSKIGVNIHMSFGPSSTRTYQLPANGVMQICDCSDGLDDVFEIDKEVVTYHSIEEAVELIKYYLEHDDERKKIAADGFKRVIKDYKRIDTFSKAIDEIKEGMIKDGITHFKDGSNIK